MGQVGGENWPRNMGVWSWRIRGVLPEITLLLVCSQPLFFVPLFSLLDFLIASTVDSEPV